MGISKFGKLLEIALKQGEGFGTAYEYYVKLNLLRNFLKKTGHQPKSILLAGLPEKYGYSLDIALLSQELKAELTVVDEREIHLNKFLKLSQEMGILSKDKCTIVKVDDLSNLSLNRNFDLIISCEVLQYMNANQRMSYIKGIASMSINLAVFAPNSGNKAHEKFSQLQSLSLEELTNLMTETDLQLAGKGYLDTPPFPCGVKISRESNDEYHSGYFHKLVSLCLSTWTGVERICPDFIMRKVSHLIYVLALRKPEI